MLLYSGFFHSEGPFSLESIHVQSPMTLAMSVSPSAFLKADLGADLGASTGVVSTPPLVHIRCTTFISLGFMIKMAGVR